MFGYVYVVRFGSPVIARDNKETVQASPKKILASQLKKFTIKYNYRITNGQQLIFLQTYNIFPLFNVIFSTNMKINFLTLSIEYEDAHDNWEILPIWSSEIYQLSTRKP